VAGAVATRATVEARLEPAWGTNPPEKSGKSTRRPYPSFFRPGRRLL